MLADKNRNGKISYQEFQSILNTPTTEESKRAASPMQTVSSPGRHMDVEKSTIAEIAKVI